MKKTLSRVVNLSAATVILLGAFQAIAINMIVPAMASAYAGGDGSSTYPYRIEHCSQLQDMQNDLSAHYVIMNDLFDCSGWTPISNFTGTLDGRGFQVYNISVSRSTTDNSGDQIGMFSSLNGATIKNLSLQNEYLTGHDIIGGLAGRIMNGTTVSNVSTNAQINGHSYIGGLVGVADPGVSTISRSYATGPITISSHYAGGLIGDLEQGIINDSWSNVAINADPASNGIAGIAGFMYAGSSINRSYALGSISGGTLVGGIVGYSYTAGSINDSFSNVSMTGGSSVGGLAGLFYGGSNVADSFFDQSKAGVSVCDANGNIAGCTAVNADGTDNNHFYATNSIAPFTTGNWNFTDVWQNTGSWPGLRAVTLDALAGLPAADPVTVVTATPNASSIDLSWTAPAPNAGGATTDYVIEYKVSSDSSWSTFTDGTSTDTSTSITDLTPDTDYDVQVAAVNSGGQSNFVGTDTHTNLPSTNIENCQQLQDIQYAPTADYTLEGDIDCSETSTWNAKIGGGYYGFNPISGFFSGSLDGQGHTISNLYINRGNIGGAGLFAYLQTGASVSNLNIDAANIEGDLNSGGLAGYVATGTTINYVHMTNSTVKGNESTGGLIGIVQGSEGSVTVSNSSFQGLVGPKVDADHSNYVAGLVGAVQVGGGATAAFSNVSVDADVSGFDASSWGVGGVFGEIQAYDDSSITINGASSDGTVSGGSGTGGIVGAVYAQYSGSGTDPGIVSISNSHSDSAVYSTDTAGGLIGYSEATDGGTIDVSSSYATGQVEVTDGNGAGGLVGEIEGDDWSTTISQSYATGNIWTDTGGDAGGLVGYIGVPATITDAYATGVVTGNFEIGGLIGAGYGDFTNVYATGSVSLYGGDYVGGLIGAYYSGELDNSFATGAVSSQFTEPSYIGGLIGYTNGSESNGLFNDYYAPDTTGQPECIGSGTFGQCSTHSGNDDPNYYFDPANDPMTAWDFSSIWVSHADGYPTFQFDDGTNNPVIHNCLQLQAIQDNPTGDYVLANDIDCSDTANWNEGNGFNPIVDFNGSLNGNGHTVTGLTINRSEDDGVGLFRNLLSSTITNLTISGGMVSGYEDVGTLAGWIDNNSIVSINNVHTDMTVKGRYYTGGLIGYANARFDANVGIADSSTAGTIGPRDGDSDSIYEMGGLIGYLDTIESTFSLTGSSSSANINANDQSYNIGGIIGRAEINDDSTITFENLSTTGNVTGRGYVGGIFGQFYLSEDDGGTPPNVQLVNASSTGNITGKYNIGGLVGQMTANDNATAGIRGSHSSSHIISTGDDGQIGGLVGSTNGYDTNLYIRQSYATGSVDAPESYSVGGLVGQPNDRTLIINSYATGNVTGYRQVGGLVGSGSTIITNSYASGQVAGDDTYGLEIGGLVGQAWTSQISNSFSTGQVTGPSPSEDNLIGGLIGLYDGDNTYLQSNAYDRENSTQPECSYYYLESDVLTYANSLSYQCVIVNQENSEPNYFLGNSNNGPLSLWNFEGTWQTNTDALPTLSALGSYGTPDAPSGLTSTGSKEDLHLSWTAPENSGGSPIVGYYVEYQAHGDSDDWETLAITNGTELDVSPDAVDYYSNYDFRVTTITEADRSSPTDAYSANIGQNHTISSCEDLQNMSNDLSGNYVLTQDIDCSETAHWNDDGDGGYYGFEPIGINDDDFTGTLDGQGHKITDLYINRDYVDGSREAGLIYYADHANIVNLSLVGGSITGGNTSGAFAAYAYATNAYKLSSDLDVTALNGSYVGGLFGEFWSYNGINHGLVSLSNSYSTGQVSGSYTVGGLVGWSMEATITNSYYNGLVSATDEYSGGLVGYGESIDILSSYAAGGVTSTSYYNGGLVGWLNGDNFIASSFAANTVEGSDTDYIGAIAGYNNGNIAFQNDSYDAGISGLSNCLADNSDGDDCHAVNTMENQNSAYYMNNNTNAPLNTWDFEGTWRTTDSYPVLQGFNFTPDNPSLTTGSATSSRVKLNWNEQSGIDHYVVQYEASSAEGEGWVDYHHLDSPDANSVTINGLTHNTSYDFRVKAVGTSGESDWSNVVTKSTTNQIYNITNCDQLQDMQGDVAGTYTLQNYIDCSDTVDWNGGAGFWPISNMDWQNPFSGSLDGDGWGIGNLSINRTGPYDDNSGLFYTVNLATIKNFNISGNVDGRYAAASIAAFANNTNFENIHTSMDVTTYEGGEGCTGGLVACLGNESYDSGHIVNSSSSGEINGYWDVGGLVGYAYKLTLSHSYSTSFLTGYEFVGGLVGYMSDSFASDIYSTGGVSADNTEGRVGGLFGGIYSTYIDRAYSSDQVFGTYYVGGLAGDSANSQIHNSFSESAVSGADGESRGAVVGVDSGGTVLFNTYFDQNRTEQDYCIGNVYPVGGCESFNTDGSDQAHYFGSTSLTPLDTWDFNGTWVAHDDGLPTLSGVPFLEDQGIKAQTTTTTITVSWEGADPNGNPITGYELYYKKGGDSAWIPVTINPALATSATVSGLTPSTRYDFSWRPINANGKGSRIEFYTFTKDAAVTTPNKSVVVVTSSAKKSAQATAADESAALEINLDDFSEYAIGTGKTLDLFVGQIVHFTITRNGVVEHHSATVKEVGGDYVILTIASTPFDLRLQVGELKTVTIDGEAVMQISLNSINGGVASLQFSKLATAVALPATTTPAQSITRDLANFFGLLCLMMAAYLAYEAAMPQKPHKRRTAGAH
jgi:mucin-19